MDFVKILVGVGMLSMIGQRLVDGLIKPVINYLSKKKNWSTDTRDLIMMLSAWGVSSIVVWLSGLNLLDAYIPSPVAGQILTALIGGGGSNLLNDIWPQKVGSGDAAPNATDLQS